MVAFEFNIHSIIDIITNSSSELFVFEAKTGDILKDLISGVYPDYLTEYREVELLSDLSDKLELPIQQKDYSDNIYWVYGIVLKDKARMNAEEAMKKLAILGIGCRPFFYPMHLQPVFNKLGWYNNEVYPVAENSAEFGFYIPSGLALTENNIHEVSDKLHLILN